MIDKRELRIGNFLMVEDSYQEIDEVHETYIMYYSECGYDTAKYKELQPIPVTEEMLENMKFSRNHSLGEPIFEKKVGSCNVTISYGSNKDECDWSVHIDNNRFESIGGLDFQYLHELQNFIFMATGQELEVVL